MSRHVWLIEAQESKIENVRVVVSISSLRLTPTRSRWWQQAPWWRRGRVRARERWWPPRSRRRLPPRRRQSKSPPPPPRRRRVAFNTAHGWRALTLSFHSCRLLQSLLQRQRPLPRIAAPCCFCSLRPLQPLLEVGSTRTSFEAITSTTWKCRSRPGTWLYALAIPAGRSSCWLFGIALLVWEV